MYILTQINHWQIIIYQFYYSIKMNPESSLNLSMKKLDHSTISKSQLNTSVSKMQYSFPKTNRFSEQHPSFSPNKYYQLPSMKMNRSTSFGYGNKVDMGKRNFVTPPPDRYQLQSQFKNNNKVGITMAQGRSDVKTNDLFFQPLKNSPNPQSYSPKNADGSSKYSIHMKLQDFSDKWTKCVPGPGSYSYLNLTRQTGKSPVAKHYSVTSGKFDQLPRLSEAQMQNNKNPGPNQYKNSAQILNDLKYSKKAGSIFPRGARKGIVEKSITPGPGNYATFSEF